MGRRTASNLRRTAGGAATGDPSNYLRLLSEARWSGIELGGLLIRMILGRFLAAGPVRPSASIPSSSCSSIAYPPHGGSWVNVAGR